MTPLEQFMRACLLRTGARMAQDRKDFGDNPASYNASVRRVGKTEYDFNNDFGYYLGKSDGKYIVCVFGKHDANGRGEVTHREIFSTVEEMQKVWELDVW